MRETQTGYVADSPLQFALRETQQGFVSLKQWSVLLALVVVLTVSGPFQTLSSLPLPQRAAFWAAIVIGGVTAGDFAASCCRIALIKRGCPQPFRAIITGLVAGATTLPIILAIEWVTFGSHIFNAAFVAETAGYAMLMGLVVAAVTTILQPSAATAQNDAAPEERGGYRLIQRLPFEKRGELISLSVADHYVDVTTTKGKHLLLMRLGDAIGEAEPKAGLQIHRSHWVALDGIKSVERRNGKVLIETVAGQSLPVSRSYLPQVREAGLIT